MANLDDEFGGFEEATNAASNPPENHSNKLPEWLLGPSLNPPRDDATSSQQFKSTDAKSSTNNSEIVKHLQEELSRTKELLLDQQTNLLQLQIQHRQELEENGNSIKRILEKALSSQREIMLAEFRSYQADQEARILSLLKDINQKYEQQLNERFETKLAEFQGSLIKHCESSFEDVEIKIKHAVDASLKEEFLGDKLKLKQSFERLERDLKTDLEKHVQTYFRAQSEIYKEQIKSGVMQEHLIHRDLINSKLEKLSKTSEEKRRRTQLLFARHLSGLNFFVDNAHKQLGILKEAYKDLIKDKDNVDNFGSLSSLSLATLGLGKQTQKSGSRDNLSTVIDDEALLDENLLQDIS